VFCASIRSSQEVVHKAILQNINAHVRPRDLLAIMGASGAGKTTMLGRGASRIKNYIFVKTIAFQINMGVGE
jgi:ABC-type lipoprotein export system ATPase subunit